MEIEIPDLRLIKNKFWFNNHKLIKETGVCYGEFRITMFPQTWSSTALGFDNEVGGDSFTEAYTTIIKEVHTGWYGVFFNNRFAYKVKNPNELFFEDMHRFEMKPVSQMEEYIK